MDLIDLFREKYREKLAEENLSYFNKYQLPNYSTEKIMPVGDLNSEIIIVRDVAPYLTDKAHNESQEDTLNNLIKVLEGYGIRHYYILPSSPFLPMADFGKKLEFRPPNLREQATSRNLLWKCIENTNIKHILLYGNVSTNLFTESNVLDEHGKSFNFFNRLFFPVYSLDYIKDLKSRKINTDYQQEEFKADIKNFVQSFFGYQELEKY